MNKKRIYISRINSKYSTSKCCNGINAYGTSKIKGEL